ncbi:hypothetical protein BX600DRAFT_428797 [Xylariales sp. PMI_506]|nr:hypothetical protein BX600DRAFT_428797 [Xylariales sp. PMI_506]
MPTSGLLFSPTGGDVDEAGQYWATASGLGWFQVDFKPGSSTYGQLVNGALNLSPVIQDWAYVPGGGNYLYALATSTTLLGATSTVMMQFDRSSHSFNTLTNLGALSGRNSWGAVFATADGFLYGEESNSGDIYKFTVPPAAITATKVTSGTIYSSNDGARCITAAGIS